MAFFPPSKYPNPSLGTHSVLLLQLMKSYNEQEGHMVQRKETKQNSTILYQSHFENKIHKYIIFHLSWRLIGSDVNESLSSWWCISPKTTSHKLFLVSLFEFKASEKRTTPLSYFSNSVLFRTTSVLFPIKWRFYFHNLVQFMVVRKTVVYFT